MRAKRVCHIVALIGVLGICGMVTFSPQEQVELWVDDDPGCENHIPCFTSIQEAIDTAPAEVSFIRILPGSYRENLIIQGKEINLIGSGTELTILSAADPDRPTIFVSDLEQPNDNSSIRYLKIEGGSVGIEIERVYDIEIVRNQIVVARSRGIGIRVTSVEYINIENNEIRGLPLFSTKGIDLFDDVGNVIVARNHIYDIAVDGIKINDGNIEVRENHIEKVMWGIVVSGEAEGLIEYNYLTNSNIGVGSESRIEIRRNVIQGFNRYAGISIYAHRDGTLAEPVVRHNRVSGCLIGIAVEDWRTGQTSGEKVWVKPLIEHNLLETNQTGVVVDDPTVEVTLRYNSFLNNEIALAAPHPLRLMTAYDGGSRLRAEYNYFKGNKVGIVLGGGLRPLGQATLIGNDISNNEYGVVINDDRTIVTVERNTITYNGGYGIGLAWIYQCQVPDYLARRTFREEEEQVKGNDNEIRDNGQDLCPPDYPWPEGFVKEP